MTLKFTRVASLAEITGKELATILTHKNVVRLTGTYERMIGGKIAHQEKVYARLTLSKWGTLQVRWNKKFYDVAVTRVTNDQVNFFDFKMVHRDANKAEGVLVSEGATA